MTVWLPSRSNRSGRSVSREHHSLGTQMILAVLKSLVVGRLKSPKGPPTSTGLSTHGNLYVLLAHHDPLRDGYRPLCLGIRATRSL